MNYVEIIHAIHCPLMDKLISLKDCEDCQNCHKDKTKILLGVNTVMCCKDEENTTKENTNEN